ncbi:hypothetical protein IH970_08175 [candidate division KSB1 bacterium]|nr:hypothetical protein [candidate division KSB1 bacterium]
MLDLFRLIYHFVHILKHKYGFAGQTTANLPKKDSTRKNSICPKQQPAFCNALSKAVVSYAILRGPFSRDAGTFGSPQS